MDKKLMSLPCEYSIENSELSDDLAKVTLKVYHFGLNLNNTYFDRECFETSKESFKLKPIVGNIIYEEDGSCHWGYHDEEEVPKGVIMESNNYRIEHDEENEKDYVVVEGVIFKEYCADAYKLLTEKENTDISMEIMVEESYIDSNNVYHITKFNFLAATIIKDSPAMKGANIKFFNITKESSEQFALAFSAMINKTNQLVAKYSATEGGQSMDKRNEIIEKFATLSNVEGYSAIIENDNLSDEELEKQLFNLSVSQISNSIREALSSQKIIKTYWDGEAYETSKYLLEDIIIDEGVAIVFNKENCTYCGIPYILKGDKAELNYEESKRYVIGNWRPYSEGEEEPKNTIETFTNEIVEAAKGEISKVKDSFDAKTTEEYKALENNLELAQEELKDAKAKYVDLEAENESLKTQNQSLTEDNKELKEFKLSKDKEEKDAAIESVLSKFTNISQTEAYKDVFEKRYEFSLEELEKELKVVAYDNGESIKNVNKNIKKKSINSYKLDNDSCGDKSKYRSVWDEEFEE